jgi:hypothetical protein
MTTDCSTIDLATLNTAQGAMVTALRGKVCQWEKDSADAAADGNFSTAATIQQWAIAADLLLNTISIEFSVLFSRALTARFDDQRSIAHYSVAKQVLGAVALEVTGSQGVAELIAV